MNTKKPKKQQFSKVHFGIVICRNPKTQKWLAVDESKNRGWWVPGGGVDKNETFAAGALRECIEEAGVEVELKGVLKCEHFVDDGNSVWMRVVFYAEPKDHDVIPKQVADKESVGAAWLTLDEFKAKDHIRGNELIQWASYIEKGG